LKEKAASWTGVRFRVRSPYALLRRDLVTIDLFAMKAVRRDVFQESITCLIDNFAVPARLYKAMRGAW
jgi:hypothetical protein